MSLPEPASLTESKDEAILLYRDLDAASVAAAVVGMLGEEGYRLEKGALPDATFGKGSHVGRLLVGALVKRFVFRVQVVDDGSGIVELRLSKGISGRWGGLIGVNQMNREFSRLLELLDGRGGEPG